MPSGGEKGEGICMRKQLAFSHIHAISFIIFQEDEYSHSTPKLNLVTLHMFLHLASTFCKIYPVETLGHVA